MTFRKRKIAVVARDREQGRGYYKGTALENLWGDKTAL